MMNRYGRAKSFWNYGGNKGINNFKNIRTIEIFMTIKKWEE